MDTVVDWVFAVGRGTIALVLAWLALRYHFGAVGMRYAESYRAPFPGGLLPVSGVAIVVAAVALLLGAWADLAALVLVALLFVATYYMHPAWKEHDPQARAGQLVHCLKNLGLAGGLLVIFYVYYELGDDVALSLTDPVLD